jgi:hypothetical protein
MKKRSTKGPHYSGAHKTPQRKVSAEDDEWERWRVAAEAKKLSRAEWLRWLANRECERRSKAG